MEKSFWKSRWHNGQTGWHLQRVNPHLVEYWSHLELDQNATVFIPFCGESLDVDWLANREYHIIGNEVIAQPVQSLMERRTDSYHTKDRAKFTVYRTNNISIWNGDFFNLPVQALPEIDAIYDRGSLVALPPEKRKQYAQRMIELASAHTQMLLIAYEYDQTEMDGPPYSVSHDEIESNFGSLFNVEHLFNKPLPDQLAKFKSRGLSTFLDLNVYLLH